MARGIKVVDWLIPNNEELKLVDTDYVQHTYSGTDKTQTEINDSILNGTIYKTINGQSIIAESGDTNIYTSTDSYVTCSTEEDVDTKVITIKNYQQVNGGNIRIKFTYANTLTPEDPNVIKLRINTKEDGSTYVEGELYYNSNPVTGSNSWSAGETVAVYYDGTNYMANNVASAELSSTANTSSPNTKKGLTEAAIVSVIGDVRKSGGVYQDLQSQIDALSVTSTTVNLRVRNSSATSFVNLVGASGSEATWQIYGTSTPLEATMQLQRRTNDSSGTWSAWANDGSVTSATNDSNEAFYRTISTDTPITYEFRSNDTIYNTTKITNSVYFYYVQQVYYGALLAYDNDDPEEPIIYNSVNDLISGTLEHPEHLTGAYARTNAKGTYSMNFDIHPRRVYILVPRVKVGNINPSTVYWVSVINSNLMPFSRAKGSDGTTNIDEGTAYYAYYSDRVYDVAEGTEGARNIIFN